MPTLERQKQGRLEHLQAVLRHPNAQQVLGAARARTGVIATTDGLVIDTVVYAGERPDVEDIAATAASALHAMHLERASAGQNQRGGIELEYREGGGLVVDPLGGDALIAFLVESGADPDRIRTVLSRLIINPNAPAEPGTSAEPVPDAPAEAQPAALPTTGTELPHSAAGRAEEARPSELMEEQSGKTPVNRSVRLILGEVHVNLANTVATALVELTYHEHRAVGKAVGRNLPENHLSLVAEATIRAVTEFLSDGHGVVLEHIKSIQADAEQVLLVKVLFLTPTGEQSLLGIARVDGNAPASAAKAVLGAVNRRVELVLAQDGAA